jgi:DNA polymerase (family 10)
MTNKEIAKLLKLTAALLEIHDENQFKIRPYTNAVFNIEKQEDQLVGKSIEELEALDGIGKGLAKSITQIIDSGTFDLLEELKSSTPEGVLEMIDLKGIGPKKIKTIWKDLNIVSTDQLYEACENGQIAKLKGFGLKTQEAIKENLAYIISQRGKLFYADAEPLAEQLLQFLNKIYPDLKVALTGEMRRKMETVDVVEILVGNKNPDAAIGFFEKSNEFSIDPQNSGPFTLRGSFTQANLKWLVRFTEPKQFESTLMLATGAGYHLEKVVKDDRNLYQYLLDQPSTTEREAYKAFDMPYIEPELREGTFELLLNQGNPAPELLEVKDLKGPLHNHSNYSDGKNTIRELAQYCINRGFEYLGLSDHSKSAFYANGLREFDIIRQHKEIDELNKELAPFRIFKGIESDILSDGALDYDKDVLASFDFIVASIHSNLNMDIEKATTRLLKAIENPYTTILGHPTGRLLLKRQGYPVDYKKVIDACARHQVIIEINANPWRLDLDWRWVRYALEQQVLLSINPDAHELEGFEDMKYGVYVGRKGGLTKDMTFNTLSLDSMEKYLAARRTNIIK